MENAATKSTSTFIPFDNITHIVDSILFVLGKIQPSILESELPNSLRKIVGKWGR